MGGGSSPDAQIAATKPRSLIPEFKRFTNALKAQGEARQKWWSFTADSRGGIIVVAVNQEAAGEKANALRALVQEWKGEVYEYGE